MARWTGRTMAGVLGLGAAAVLILAAQQVVRSQGTFKVERGVNRPGFDYSRTDPVSLDECQARCERDPKCKTFVYVAPPDFRAGCYLKEVVPDSTSDPACITGTRSAEDETLEKKADPKKPKAGEKKPPFRYEEGVNRPGFDYKRFGYIKTLKDCEAKCAADKNCKVFVLAVKPHPNAGCYLKKQLPKTSKEDINKYCTVGIRQ